MHGYVEANCKPVEKMRKKSQQSPRGCQILVKQTGSRSYIHGNYKLIVDHLKIKGKNRF